MSAPLYYEDFEPGWQFTTRGYHLEKDDSIRFATAYDPQYFHIDEEKAKAGIWGELVASGWQTAAITMRLKTESPLRHVAGGLIGLGLESVRWPRPVFPGDTLHAVITVTEKRASTSKPGYGVVKYKVETFNQNHELVMEMITAVLMPRKQ